MTKLPSGYVVNEFIIGIHEDGTRITGGYDTPLTRLYDSDGEPCAEQWHDGQLIEYADRIALANEMIRLWTAWGRR